MFCIRKFNRIENYLIFWRGSERDFSQLTKSLSILTQKVFTKLSEFDGLDPGSGKNFSRIQGPKRPLDPDPQHWLHPDPYGYRYYIGIRNPGFS
jgi:hypothetical protein